MKKKMNQQDKEKILKGNYQKILKDAKKIELETPEHFLTVLSVMLEDPLNKKRFIGALDYLDSFLKYRSTFVRDLLELIESK